MSPFSEKIVVWCAITFALFIFFIGAWLAFVTKEPEWLNRAGALIVCTESLVVLGEFLRRTRLQKLEETYPDNVYLRHEARRAEKQIVILAVVIAIIGEFLHGFGDLIMTFVFTAFPS
jgi:hypothetical protein